MHALRLTLATVTAGLLVASGCRTTQPAPASTGTATAAQPAPATSAPAVTSAPVAAGAQAAPDTTRRRRRPDPATQEAARRRVVAELMTQIAGREREPAGRVFKNVRLHEEMPAGEFLTMMNEQFGRGLGMLCGNCHVPGTWDSDEKKNKGIAREMVKLVERLNTRDLPAIPELEKEFDKVSCVTCHRGSGHPANTMPAPAPAAATPSGAPTR